MHKGAKGDFGPQGPPGRMGLDGFMVRKSFTLQIAPLLIHTYYYVFVFFAKFKRSVNVLKIASCAH